MAVQHEQPLPVAGDSDLCASTYRAVCLQGGSLMSPEIQTYPLDASLTFAEGAPKWLQAHKRYIKPNTLRNYQAAVKLLTAFLGNMRLSEITVNDFRRYQELRRERAGPYLLNSELGVLSMVLKECGEWHRIEKFYKPLRVPKRCAGHSISKEQELTLREVAFSKPKWRLAAHCMVVMLSTTMGFGELRQLRRRDVDMNKRCVLVREGAKNDYRNRTIPMNAAAYDSMSWILDRWKRLGGWDAEHYILPHRPRGERAPHWRTKIPYILTEPMTGIATAFRGIREASGLEHFRIYDCRVQAITKLLSNPAVSPQVSKEIAGHISQAMQDRYSIQRFETKKAALDALENPLAPPPPEPTAPVSDPLPEARRQGAAAAWEEIHAKAQAQPAKPEPPLSTPTLVQAEIARQVALALRDGEEDREKRYVQVQPAAKGPRLLRFPGAG
jgi:integrase